MKLVIRNYFYVEPRTSLLVVINSRYAIYETRRKYSIYSNSPMSNYIFMIHNRGSRPVHFATFYMFTVHDSDVGTGHENHVINMSFCAPQD